MARLTVEDCKPFVSNRFELVIIAATRSRDILSGSPISVERDSDKTPVVALREIAAQSVSVDKIKEMAVRNFQSSGNQIALEQNEDGSITDSFMETESSDLVSPEFSRLDNDLDQITDILEGDLDSDLDIE